MPCVSITLLISFGVVKLQVFFNVVELKVFFSFERKTTLYYFHRIFSEFTNSFKAIRFEKILILFYINQCTNVNNI